MNQSKTVRASRGPGWDEAIGLGGKVSTMPRRGASQQHPRILTHESESCDCRRECPSQARLRGSDETNTTCSPPPTPPPTEQMRRFSAPLNQMPQSNPCHQHSRQAERSAVSSGVPVGTTGSKYSHEASSQTQHDAALAAATIDLAPFKAFSEESELEIHTPWMQFEYAASDSIASTMDCSCSLPLSMASSSQISHAKNRPPVPPSTPSCYSSHSRHNSGHMSQATSRSSLSHAACTKSLHQRGDSSAMSLGNSVAMSTSSASCSLELSAALDSSGALPPRTQGASPAPFRSQTPHLWHKHPSRTPPSHPPRTYSRQEPQQQQGEHHKRTTISQMVYWVQRDAKYAASVAETLLRSYGLAVASEAATSLFPVACSHPSQVAVLLQFVLGRPELRPEQVWAMHVLLVRAPKCALETLLAPRYKFHPFRALASIISDLENAAVAQSMARVLHHAAAAGAPVASSIDLAPLVAACERLGCKDAVRDLLVALWQQNQNDTDAAHNCIACMECPEITKPDLDVPMKTLKRIAVPGTDVRECFMLVPTAEPPYFGRQRCVFPAAPLADVAPAAAEVASSTLGTGMHGVVVRANLCGQNHALKVAYRTAEASLGLQTEVEAHSRIWATLAERGHMPSPHLCLASFVVYSDVVANGRSVFLIDGLAMPCVDGTLWDFWNHSSSESGALAAGAAADAANPVTGSLRGGVVSDQTELPDLAWMALTLADGLCSLHAADSVHNDLHPQNVGVRRLLGDASGSNVSAAFESHVLDLGRVVTSGTDCEPFQNDGSFWPVWHPPEAIHDQGKEGDKVTLSSAADVWAFGCILVSLLRGSAPEFALTERWSHAKWTSLASGSMWREALHDVADDALGLKAVAIECLRIDPLKRPLMSQIRDTLSACARRAGFKLEPVR